MKLSVFVVTSVSFNSYLHEQYMKIVASFHKKGRMPIHFQEWIKLNVPKLEDLLPFWAQQTPNIQVSMLQFILSLNLTYEFAHLSSDYSYNKMGLFLSHC